MIAWHALSPPWILYGHLGLRLVDDFTGGAPRYPVFADLEFQDSGGGWNRIAGFEPSVAPSGTLTYSGLGRSAYAAVEPVVRHRVLLRSEHYRPEYLKTADAVEFDVHPYDDQTPPAVAVVMPQVVLMIPSGKYGYENHVRVLRGLVLDTAGDPVANVEVFEGVRERALSDERGAYALPLRWPPLTGAVAVDALDHRTGRTDSIVINLPGDLAISQNFTIT